MRCSIERAVVILKEAFDLPYGKKKLTLERTRFQPPGNKHEELMRKFLEACVNDNRDELIDLLREDVAWHFPGHSCCQHRPLAFVVVLEHRLFDFVRAVHCVLVALLIVGVVGAVFTGVAVDADEGFAGGLQTEQGV